MENPTSDEEDPQVKVDAEIVDLNLPKTMPIDSSADRKKITTSISTTKSTQVDKPTEEDFLAHDNTHERTRKYKSTNNTQTPFSGSDSHASDQRTIPEASSPCRAATTLSESTSQIPVTGTESNTSITQTSTTAAMSSPHSQASLPDLNRPILKRSTTSFQKVDVLSRIYDPSKDQRSIEELLARPRLPRSPYEVRKGSRESEGTSADQQKRMMEHRTREFNQEIMELKAAALTLNARDAPRKES